MGVWGLDIFEDDLAVDIRDEFESYLDEGMDESEAIEELLLNNNSLLDDNEESGTFILTIALLAKENEITNNKIKKLLKELKNNKEYWNYLQDDSMELYEARLDLFRELN